LDHANSTPKLTPHTLRKSRDKSTLVRLQHLSLSLSLPKTRLSADTTLVGLLTLPLSYITCHLPPAWLTSRHLHLCSRPQPLVASRSKRISPRSPGSNCMRESTVDRPRTEVPDVSVTTYVIELDFKFKRLLTKKKKISELNRFVHIL